MRVIDVARRFRVSPDMIRDLERDEKIPRVPRDLNGHRRFRTVDIERIGQVLFPGNGDSFPAQPVLPRTVRRKRRATNPSTNATIETFQESTDRRSAVGEGKPKGASGM